ncbi:hypothetical protein BH24ACI4_BH24ACI4_34570 [soil metagenome]
MNFQTPIAYGAFNVADNFEPDFQVPWPAPGGIADMQGGMNRVRMPDGTLNHFTSASGVEIYRGHRLPQDMLGDLLFGEPVGRVVRRAKVVETEGLTQLRNAYPKSEFIRSTDPLFRPVAVHNAPDGMLIVVDMYTGIIQDAQFVGPGSYLRRKIDQYGLDELHNFGRIWRISYESMEPDRRQPRMYSETAADLVKHLEHPNGWWRDTAQKLLVLRQDKSVVPALRTLARSGGDQLGRIHALWTLEGLSALDAPLVRELMKSPDTRIRIQAIRASETLYKAGDKSFAAEYRALAEDRDPDVVIQAMLTLNVHKVPAYEKVIRAAMASNPARGVKEIGGQILRPVMTYQGQRPSLADAAVNALNLTTDQRRVMQRGGSHLPRGLRRLPRRGRCRGADDGCAGGDQAGAAARRRRARGWPPRLRDQGAAARIDRADRRPGVPRWRDGGNWQLGTGNCEQVTRAGQRAAGSGQQAAGSGKQEAGSGKGEAGSRKQETGSGTGDWELVAGNWEHRSARLVARFTGFPFTTVATADRLTP